jgi:hypothetical protein
LATLRELRAANGDAGSTCAASAGGVLSTGSGAVVNTLVAAATVAITGVAGTVGAVAAVTTATGAID